MLKTSTPKLHIIRDFVVFVLFSILYAISYGILNDLVTANICPDYFNNLNVHPYHAKITLARIPTYKDNTIILALFWGVIATWCLGIILGSIISLCIVATNFHPLKRFTLKRGAILLSVQLVVVLVVCFGIGIIYKIVASPLKHKIVGMIHNTGYIVNILAAVFDISYVLYWSISRRNKAVDKIIEN